MGTPRSWAAVRRVEFALALACPGCGAAGTARASQEDHLGLRSPDFRVESCPPEFEVAVAGSALHRTVFRCRRCGGLLRNLHR